MKNIKYREVYSDKSNGIFWFKCLLDENDNFIYDEDSSLKRIKFYI